MTPSIRTSALGILFDLDGVLVDSSACLFRAWCEWAAAHGIDGEAVYAIGSGRTTLEQIRAVAPELATETEVSRLDALEETYVTEVKAQRGARRALEDLRGARWGIVTSCPLDNAAARLRQAGLPVPDTFVCAGDVVEGKPAPDAYLLGVQRLGLPPRDVLVFEDAPLGITAAKAAGAQVTGLTTTHAAEELRDADFRVADLAGVTFSSGGGGRIAVTLAATRS
jgi:mannitol-1-/sugar-/sorbitol-6-phosphatase